MSEKTNPSMNKNRSDKEQSAVDFQLDNHKNLVEEMTSKTLPEVKDAMVVIDDMEDKRKQEVTALKNELDMEDSNSIIYFGTKAQAQLSEISDTMLEGVKNKDIGPAGNSLSEMITVLRGFEVDELDPNKKPGFFARLFGKTKPLVKFIQRYEDVRKQVDSVTDNLENHKTKLLTDVTSLDRLYDANLNYFHDLENYILAGELKLTEINKDDLPALAKQVEKSENMIEAQKLRDLRTSRDDLERRVSDLRLTRQVTMQSLPSIRLIQENDKGLIRKIQSTIANTVPLWRQQLAQAVTIYRSSEAARSVKSANDLTNELLASNAENLKQANAEVRKEIERGIFDIEVVKQANKTLIETIEESLVIADEGKKMRHETMVQLQQAEKELREKLASAHAQSTHAQ